MARYFQSLLYLLVSTASNINISVKSLRIAVLMIMKKYGRSEILCSFVARYNYFGQFFACFVSDLWIIRAWKQLVIILNLLRKNNNFAYITRDIRNCPCGRFFLLSP